MYNLLIGNAEIGIVVTLVLLCSTPPLIIGIAALQKKVVKNQNYKIDGSVFTVKYDTLTVWLCAVVAVLFTAVASAYLVSYLLGRFDESHVDMIIINVCSSGAAAIIYGTSAVIQKRRQIQVSGDGIIFVPGLGKRREYDWEDIICVKSKSYRKSAVYKVYVKQEKRKAFAFSDGMIGGQLFAGILRDGGLVCDCSRKKIKD